MLSMPPPTISIRSSTLWAMPPCICNTLLMGASTGLPPSASTLRAGTGALAGPGICNILDLTDGALGSATWLSSFLYFYLFWAVVLVRLSERLFLLASAKELRLPVVLDRPSRCSLLVSFKDLHFSTVWLSVLER